MNAPKHPVPPRAMSPTRAAAAAVAAAAALALTFLFALALSPALAVEEKHFRVYTEAEAPGFRFGPRALAAAQFAESATLTVSFNGAGAAAAATTNGQSARTVTVASSGAGAATGNLPPAATGKCAAAWAQCGGNGFAGSTCCTPGHGCAYQSEWYESPP